MKKIRLILLLLTFMYTLNLSAYSKVTTWQIPEGFAFDKYYQLKGYDTPIASYVVCDFSGQVNMVVNTLYCVRSVDIRQLRSGLKPEYTGNNLFHFKRNKPEIPNPITIHCQVKR
jgi:hypothetical protein